jgi:RNA polymerase sigma-70 factor (ECF subfamily)
MMDDTTFSALVGRVRAGDEHAATELVRHFEPELRLIVRATLPERLRSRLDSMDVVQSVWSSLLRPAEPGDPLFKNPRHFLGYLAGMVRNKVWEEYRRRTRSQKYALAREEPLYHRRGGRDQVREVASSDPSPSEAAQASDRLRQLLDGRSDLVARIVDLRREGRTFPEIAEQTGVSERTARRVIDELRSHLEARQWE